MKNQELFDKVIETAHDMMVAGFKYVIKNGGILEETDLYAASEHYRLCRVAYEQALQALAQTLGVQYREEKRGL